MKPKLAVLAIALVSVALTTTGCISHYASVAWSSPFLSDTGTAYVMSGTQTLKTATLFTVHGTFKDFTFPVKREFTLFEVGSETKAMGRFTHKADDCSHSDYMYFPNSRTMIARDEDGRARFQNLTTKRAAVGRGYIISHGYPASRFSLTEAKPNDTYAFYIFDSFTGASRALGRRASDFIGDTWHVTLSVSEDGRLVRRAYLSNHDITISVWDLEGDQVSVQPRVIPYGNNYREPSVLLFDEVGARQFLVAALKPVNRDGTTVKLFAVSSDVVSETTLGEWRLPFFSVLRVALNEKGNITILLNDSGDLDYPKDVWRVEDHDIATGTLISSKSIRILPTTVEVLRNVTDSGVRESGVIQRANPVE